MKKIYQHARVDIQMLLTADVLTLSSDDNTLEWDVVEQSVDIDLTKPRGGRI